jgi:1-phosphatidylinositol-3-phosphate 5-kinase
MTCRLGSKVAMFRYSSVEIYSACKPPMALQFHDPNKKEWLDVEVKNVRVYKCFSAAIHFYLALLFLHLNILLFLKVLLKWKLLFSEIENTIQGMKSRYSGEAMGENRNSSAYEGLFLEVSGMLAQEKDEFEVSLFFLPLVLFLGKGLVIIFYVLRC